MTAGVLTTTVAEGARRNDVPPGRGTSISDDLAAANRAAHSASRVQQMNSIVGTPHRGANQFATSKSRSAGNADLTSGDSSRTASRNVVSTAGNPDPGGDRSPARYRLRTAPDRASNADEFKSSVSAQVRAGGCNSLRINTLDTARASDFQVCNSRFETSRTPSVVSTTGNPDRGGPLQRVKSGLSSPDDSISAPAPGVAEETRLQEPGAVQSLSSTPTDTAPDSRATFGEIKKCPARTTRGPR